MRLFGQFQGEVRRIHILGSSVNSAPEGALACYMPLAGGRLVRKPVATNNPSAKSSSTTTRRSNDPRPRSSKLRAPMASTKASSPSFTSRARP
jgi:hypothetical protein